MALSSLPSYCKPTEARLLLPNLIPDEYRSEADRSAGFPALFREIWRCSLALAPMSRVDALAFAAFIETLDGVTGSFKMQMTPGVFGPSAATGVALASNATRGAGTLRLTVPTGGFAAGSLISLGDIEGSQFQLFEVSDAYAAGTRTVNVAPRVRFPFTAGGAAASGSDVYGRFKPASDDQGRPVINVSHGVAVLELVEGV